MHRRFSLAPITALALLTFAAALPSALSQTRLDVFVTPIPNVPFSAVIKVERAMVLPDGSIANLKTFRDIGRDSVGRIFNESRELLPESSTKTPQVLGIHLYDPQTRVSARLNPLERTFRSGVVNRPPATVPPALLYASPTGNTVPQNEFTKEEDLGTREIEGVLAHGVRDTQTIPADSSGTGKEILITDEYWYSEELRINVVLKHNDPSTGSVSMTVTQVTRAEPDANLFKIPEGYTRVAGDARD